MDINRLKVVVIGNKELLHIYLNKMYVAPILSGGLGNRIFQVACAKGYAAREDKKVVFIKSLAGPTGHGLHNTIYKLFPQIEFKTDLFPSIQLKEIPETHYIYEELPTATESILIHGYRQCWKYFSKIRIEPQFENVLGNKRIMELWNKYIDGKDGKWFIHFRFGDFDLLTHHQINRRKYYGEAIKHIPKDTILIILSDDLNKCGEYMEYLKLLNIQYIICDLQDEVEALYVMSRCCGAITANSTFSWWGSYLAHQISANHIGIYPKSLGVGLPRQVDHIPEWGIQIDSL